VNTGQVVTLISTLVVVCLLGTFWLLGGFFPSLRSEAALAAGLPLIIAVAILAPAFRSRLK
jgi:low temperature requirement protein LtrA